MATYQAGVTDYISQIQPTEPNLAFDAQILQTKQSKFDANHKKISELYGSLLNSSMSRNENIQAREEFFKNINTDIRKMAGMDFSLDENVDAAANVFQSIYNNKNIVKDMVWTSNFQNQKSRGEAFKSCVDAEKCGGQWWEGGDKYMDYKLQEFKSATNDEAMNFEDVEYVPYTNMLEKAMKYAKDNKLEITTDQLVGNYMVTTKNGPQAYGPLAELFTNLYANDPKLLKQYEAQAYVNRKDNVSAIMNETGMDENAATSEYIRRQGTAQQEKINEILNESNADEDYIKGRMEILEDKLKTGNFGKTSSVAKEYEALKQLLPGAQQASEYIKLAKKSAENANNNTYIRAIGKSLDARDAAIFMHNDISGAAKSIADNTMTQKQEADDFAKLRVAHQYDLMLENAKQSNRIALESHKAKLKGDVGNPFGKDANGKKLDTDKTVSGYIDDTYKSKYGDTKVKGAYAAEIERLKAERDLEEPDGEDYKKKDAKLKKLTLKNNENILRQKVQALDQSGIKPAFGNSWGQVYAKDKELSKRGDKAYGDERLNYVVKKGDTDKYNYSQTLGSVYGKLNGSNQEVHTPEEVDRKVKNNNATNQFTADHVFEKNVPVIKDYALKNDSVLSKEQKKFYNDLTPEKIKNAPPKLKAKIADTLNKIEASKKADIKQKAQGGAISSKNVKADSIASVINETNDPTLKEKFKEYKKKGIDKLSDAEKKEIAKEYNKVKNLSFEATGDRDLSNITTAEAYTSHYKDLQSNLHGNMSKVSGAYLNTLKPNDAEYKVFEKMALNYIKKNGQKFVNKTQNAKWKGTGDVHDGVYYKVAGKLYANQYINKESLQKLIDSDKNFSNHIYNNVFNKIKNSSSKEAQALLKDKTIRNAMQNVLDYEEDFKNHVQLKKDSHNAILGHMAKSDNFDYAFNDDFVKNGFLVGFETFYNKMKYHTDYDREDAIEEYQNYKEAYNDALSATLIEKQTKDKKYLQSGVGPQSYKRYEAENVHMYQESNASNEAMAFLSTFKKSDPLNKAMYVNGNLIEDPEQIQQYLSSIKKSKDFFNLSYSLTGKGRTSFFGDDKLDWEGMSLNDGKNKYEFLSNPKKLPSQMYLDRAQSTKDRALQITGKTKINIGNEFTDGRPVYLVKNSEGEYKFEGVLHIDGKNKNINDLLYSRSKDYTHQITSYESGKAYLDKILEDLENLENSED